METADPHVMVMKPMSDLCCVCQKNSMAIMRAANTPDAEKSQVIMRAANTPDAEKSQVIKDKKTQNNNHAHMYAPLGS